MYAESPFAGWGMGASDFGKKSLALDPAIDVRVFQDMHSCRTRQNLASALESIVQVQGVSSSKHHELIHVLLESYIELF